MLLFSIARIASGAWQNCRFQGVDAEHGTETKRGRFND